MAFGFEIKNHGSLRVFSDSDPANYTIFATGTVLANGRSSGGAYGVTDISVPGLVASGSFLAMFGTPSPGGTVSGSTYYCPGSPNWNGASYAWGDLVISTNNLQIRIRNWDAITVAYTILRRG